MCNFTTSEVAAFSVWDAFSSKLGLQVTAVLVVLKTVAVDDTPYADGISAALMLVSGLLINKSASAASFFSSVCCLGDLYGSLSCGLFRVLTT